jgi:hypothetical protein
MGLRRCGPLILASAVAAAAVPLLTAGCGGDSRAVARTGSSSTSFARQRPRTGETRARFAFVRCMRTHGVRNFPYPTARGHVSPEMVRAQGINPASPAIARIVSECLPPFLRPPKTP